jgi:hypothetical protein
VSSSVGLYGSKTWSFTLKEENRFRVFENRMLRRIFGPKAKEITGDGKGCIMRSFIIIGLFSPNITM